MFKYQEVATKIRKDISDNIYVVNEKLPDEKTLAKHYGCSKMTLKQATDQLVLEGFLTKFKGSGTYVRPRVAFTAGDMYTNKPNIFGFNNSFKDLDTETIILHFEIIKAPLHIAEKLQIKENDFIYTIERLRKIDNEPIILEQLYFSIDKIPGLTEEIIQTSIYNYIEHELKIKIYNADKIIRSKIPNQEIKDYLQMDDMDTVIELEHIVYSSNSEPIEYAKLSYKGSKYELHFITQNFD